jgi:hypothetical protein
MKALSGDQIDVPLTTFKSLGYLERKAGRAMSLPRCSCVFARQVSIRRPGVPSRRAACVFFSEDASFDRPASFRPGSAIKHELRTL